MEEQPKISKAHKQWIARETNSGRMTIRQTKFKIRSLKFSIRLAVLFLKSYFLSPRQQQFSISHQPIAYL